MRSGLTVITMNQGKVYFLSNPFPNPIALNVPWNIMYGVSKVNDVKTDLHFLEDSKANRIFDSLFLNKNAELGI